MRKTTKLLVALLLCVLMVATSLIAMVSVSAAEGDVVTEYGTIPAANAGDPFAVFMNGEFQVSTGAWDAVWYRTDPTYYKNFQTVHKLLRENPGAKVTILVRQSLSSAANMDFEAALGHLAGGEITVDLGGNTLTSSAPVSVWNQGFIMLGLHGDHDGYMKDANGNWLEKYSPDGKRPTTNLTFKNGTLLQGTGMLFYAWNYQANAVGGTSNVRFENVNFGFADSVPDNRRTVFRGWSGSGTSLFTNNAYFKNCTFDSTVFESKNYPDPVAWFWDQGKVNDSILNFTVEGGQFITNGTMVVADSTATDTTTFVKDESGSYATFRVPNGSTWQNGQAMKIDGAGNYTYAPKVLVSDGADYDVYTLPDVVTEYGVICPTHAYSGAFVLFYDDKCQESIGDWASVWYRTDPTLYNDHVTVHKLLRDNPGAEVQVLVRQSKIVTEWMAGEAYLGHLNGGTVIVDLGGNTLTSDNSYYNYGLFGLGLKKVAYGTNQATTTLTVKNGTLLTGQGWLFWLQDETGAGGKTIANFENVTFGYASNVNSGKAALCRGRGGTAGVGFVCDFNFKNCTFDTTVWEEKRSAEPTVYADPATCFWDDGNATTSTANFNVEGCQFVTNGTATIARSNATDTTTFVKDSGSYATFRVPNGSTWQNNTKLSTTEVDPKGVKHSFSLNPKMLVEDGATYDVYTFPTMVTPYGKITANGTNEYSPFAVFMNGDFQVAVGAWDAVWYRSDPTLYNNNQTVHKLLRDNPGAEVQVLVRQSVISDSGMDAHAYLGHLNGDVVVDLGGNTLTANHYQGGSDGHYLFGVGLKDASYNQGDTIRKNTLTVKNGTLLQGNSYIFYFKNDTTEGGTANVNFDNITFGYAENVPEGKRAIFRGWGGTTGAGFAVDVNFKNCTFDSTVFESKNFAEPAVWFWDGGTWNDNTKNSVINYVVDGGQFISDNPSRMEIAHDNAKDTLNFVNTSDSYATFSTPDGVTLDVWVSTDRGEANFIKLLVDGADRDVYALQFYEQISSENLMYLEYKGEKHYTAIRIPAGDDYEVAYFHPEDYAGKLESVTTGSIRLGSPAGLRFATKIDAELLALLDAYLAAGDIASVEFGTLVAPASYGEGNGFTIDELKALGRQYLNIVAGYGHYFDEIDKDESTTHFVGSVVNLYEKSVSLTFRGKGYAKVTLKSGEIVMIYADGYDTSIQDVAKKGKYDENGELSVWYKGLSDARKTIVDNFIVGKAPEVTQAESRKLNGLNVLAIGDSYFAGYRLEPTESWIGQLATRYNWNLTNLGISGKTVSGENSIYSMLMNDPNYRYGGSAATHTWGNVADVKNDEVELILVEGGFNDFNVELPLGTLADTNGNTVLGAWHLIIDQLHATYKNAKIVFVTAWEVSETKWGETIDRLEYADSLETVYNAFYANEDWAVLVDAGDPDESGIKMTDPAFRAAYTLDGNDTNHLNAKGMEIMAEYMSGELKELFNSTDAQS